MKAALAEENIETFIRIEPFDDDSSYLPFSDVWRQLWLKDDDLKAQALAILETFNTDSTERFDWDCPDCHIKIEKDFLLCWQCGYVLDSV